MGDPRKLRPHEVEIFATRELRKSGVELLVLKTHGRTPLSDSGDEFTVELRGNLRVDGADRPILVEYRNAAEPLGVPVVEALRARLPATRASGILFSTSGFAPDAIRAAREAGIAALRVADGKVAFARGSGGLAGQPPAWVPEYMAEVVDLDAAGALREKLIVAGRPQLILDRLNPEATAP